MKVNKNGFTLIEILITAGIIALLAAIAIPNLLRAKIDSNEAMAQATLKSISSALENYMSINQVYPTNTDDLTNVTPPYLNQNYFTGNYNGYTYSSVLTDYTYSITAQPVNSSQGIHSYTISSGGVLTKNP